MRLVTEATLFHPAEGINLTLVLDEHSGLRPEWAFGFFELVDRKTGEVVRKASYAVTFSPEGRSTNLDDVFESSQFANKHGKVLPEGDFLLVATVRIREHVLEAKQPVKVQVWSGNCVRRVPLLPFLR